ncbi:MAG: hypothetical protein ACREJD_16100 [Phycisphaerales bacterium]
MPTAPQVETVPCHECGYSRGSVALTAPCPECGVVPERAEETRVRFALASLGLVSIALGAIATGALSQYSYRFESFDGSVPRFAAWLALACATLMTSVLLSPARQRGRVQLIVICCAVLFAIKVSSLTPLPRWGTPLHPLFRFDWLGVLFEWWEALAIPAIFGAAIFTVSRAAKLLGLGALGRIAAKTAIGIAALLLMMTLCEWFLEPYLNRLDQAQVSAAPRMQTATLDRPMSFPLGLRRSLEWFRQLLWIFSGTWLVYGALCCWTQTRARSR